MFAIQNYSEKLKKQKRNTDDAQNWRFYVMFEVATFRLAPLFI